MAEAEQANENLSLAGRSAIVTGGSKGIGKEVALALVRAGASVTITARSLADLDSVEAAASRLGGAGRILKIVADVRDLAACENVVRTTETAFGKIDALVNNAGIALGGISKTFDTAPPKFWTADVTAWQAIMETNVLGPFLMTRCVVPRMLARTNGRIINVSSSPVVMRRPGWSPYGASKAALESLSVTWAQELADTGVTVNVVRPGGQVDTSIFAGGGQGKKAVQGFLAPDVMSELVLWLVSDASAGITGRRFSGSLWDKGIPAATAGLRAMLPYPEEPFLF